MMQILNAIIMGAALVCPVEDRFVIESEFGAEGAWTEAYLDDAWQVLVRLMDNSEVEPPRGIRVTLQKDPGAGGIGGFATPTSIGFTSNCWPKERLRLWIVAHELTNLFAVSYGGAGGYPSDWWSNGRSPFPEYVSCLVMEELGYTEAAEARRQEMQHKPDHALYWELHELYGFELFSRFFKLVMADGIDMGLVGRSWPYPGEARAAYTMAYLSMAANDNLAGLCREHDIGNEPDDWHRIHPEIRFVPYEVTDEEVERIMAVRKFLFQTREENEGLEILRELYRKGGIYPASAEKAEDGNQDNAAPGTAGAEGKPHGSGPPGDDGWQSDGPIAFQVTSEFGAESAWTARFLDRTAAALVKVLKVEDLALPDRVPVALRKDANLGGIAGGASRTSIELVSDCWPEEPFRHWILSQELANLIGLQLGGNLPEDWWERGNKPFATYASVLALRKMGYEGEADWVCEMHKGKPDHQLYWKLHNQGGEEWATKFFGLLRKDGIDYEKLAAGDKEGQRMRSLYLIAYLSLACGENVADLCSSHGVGSKPEEWDAWKPGMPFKEYRITAREVDRLIKRRNELFGGQKKETAGLRGKRERFRRGKG